MLSKPPAIARAAIEGSNDSSVTAGQDAAAAELAQSPNDGADAQATNGMALETKLFGVGGKEDPWTYVRLSMGSLAGASWRLKQALIWPSEAFCLHEDGADADGSWLESYHRAQSFEAFQRNMPFRPNSRNGTIDIVVAGEIASVGTRVKLQIVVNHIEAFIGFKVVVKTEPIALGASASFEGKKFNARVILDSVKPTSDPRSVCTIAVTAEDLYSSANSAFVTGMVDKAHCTGLFSISRYDIPHGLPPSLIVKDEKVTRTICLIKTLIREILRLCGMADCTLLKCMMNNFAGSHPNQVLSLPMSLCCVCLRKLQWLTQKDLLDRYALLASVLSNWFPEESIWLWDRMERLGMPTYTSLQRLEPIASSN